ncbi:MAG TPA: hypothetical protein VHC95_07615 [Opitutales bacterium]|nr:hypothetical protein [Opitutales bacterium]
MLTQYKVRMKQRTLIILLEAAGLVGVTAWLIREHRAQGRLTWIDWTSAGLSAALGSAIIYMIARYVGRKFAVK